MSGNFAINQCVANLTAGFIDLATYDELEKYMYGGPDATAYFVRETRKSTWFTQCPVTLAKSGGTPEFGAEWSCTISRAGDYLLGTWLHVVTPAVSLSDAVGNTSLCIAWTPNFMHALVKECCITFNDLVAARFDSAHLDFWAAFTTPASKSAGYAKMIGAALPSMGSSIEPQRLNLPLPFFYARDSGVALPTAALPYNEMRINFVFRDWRELICVFYNSQAGITTAQAINTTGAGQSALCIPPQFGMAGVVSPDTTLGSRDQFAAAESGGMNACNKLLNCCAMDYQHGKVDNGAMVASSCFQLAGLAGKVPISEASFSKDPSLSSNSVQVWANYAIVSNEERKRMACAPRDILIEQVQTMPTYLINQRYNVDVSGTSGGINGNGMSTSNTTAVQTVGADIRFSHAIKVLFFAAKNMSNASIHSNYTTGIPVLKSHEEDVCVANCGLAGRYANATGAAVTTNSTKLAYGNVNKYGVGGGVQSTGGAQQNAVNTQYGVMTKQCCLKLGCCNAKDPLQRANLVYENTQRIGFMTTDYYSLIQPYYHAPAIPNVDSNSSTWCQTGLHMYSYSLDFICLDPLGSTNYGKLTNVQINVETEGNLGMCGAAESQKLSTGGLTDAGAAVNAQSVAGGAQNTGAFNMSHASIVETLYMTGNCTQASGNFTGTGNGSYIGEAISGAYCEVPYQLVLTAVNNNIIRISGGALGFPVL